MFSFIKAFIAGILATLVFHQGLVWVFDQQGLIEATPWNMAPVAPFGVPQVVSLAFWGGLWGMLLWLLIRRALAAGYYVGAVMLGAIGPTAVALTLVPLLRGHSPQAVMDAFSLDRLWIGLALNGAWGLGVAIFMRLLHPPR